ncbi:MAG: hypothetical protein Q6353_022030 [Candidatus Sigynarchaeum springense]
MPKEMKIRLVANVVGIVTAFMLAGYAAWYAIPAFHYGEPILVITAVLCLAAAGLYFLMAKIMWALQKRTKMLGWIVVCAVGALGIAGTINFIINLSVMEKPDKFWDLAGWSIGVALLSAGSGVLIVAGKLIGEMVEKLMCLLYIGLACIGGLVVLLVIFGVSDAVENEAVILAAPLGVFCTTIAGVFFTILGYWAESVLIKKKMLVYS